MHMGPAEIVSPQCQSAAMVVLLTVAGEEFSVLVLGILDFWLGYVNKTAVASNVCRLPVQKCGLRAVGDLCVYSDVYYMQEENSTW